VALTLRVKTLPTEIDLKVSHVLKKSPFYIESEVAPNRCFSGMASNPLVHPNEWDGKPVLVVIIVLPVLAAIAVSLRLYTRVVLTKNAGVDDLCLFLAWVRKS
jgi:hypothetical protein